MKKIYLIIAVFFFASLVVLGLVMAIFWQYGRDLPDYSQLSDYRPPVTTRVHASDGLLVAEFSRENRIFVPIEAVPERLIQAYLSAEDKNFYGHFGLDVLSIARASLTNINNLVTNKRPVGASTITQQVAKNFLLTNEVSFERKIKEAILSIRIERALTKNRILELYLNEIYLGFGSYGIATASLEYFNKPLNELNLSEMAFLAALPKAPNNYHPIKKPKAAKARRDWVLNRMLEEKFITPIENELARNQSLITYEREKPSFFEAEYFLEEVRKETVDLFGVDQLYDGGLSIRTTLKSDLQRMAQQSLIQGLSLYDRRHGWRGPITNILNKVKWRDAFLDNFQLEYFLPWSVARVTGFESKKTAIDLFDGTTGLINFEGLQWARPWREGQTVGPKVKTPKSVLEIGDIIMVKKSDDEDGKNTYFLRQIPDVNGGIVVLDPHTGRVLALVGGFNFKLSQFNRAVQAKRQPGSAFKPFVFSAALDSDFTPSSLIMDAPFVIDQGVLLGAWKPENYGKKFYGPSTLRRSLEKSRNLVTVRLAQYLGMEKVVEYGEKFGVSNALLPILPVALGAGETTLIDLTAAYGVFANGGNKINTTLIDRIQNRRGKTIYLHDFKKKCINCFDKKYNLIKEPMVIDYAERIVSPETSYQIVSILEGVIKRGTGRTIKSLEKTLAGKTGTTNENRDAWFIGFSPDLVVGVYVAFDQPSSLGKNETGGRVAAPIFRNFMSQALNDYIERPFRIPEGVRLIKVQGDTGELALGQYDGETIEEAFKTGTEPSKGHYVLLGSEGFYDISKIYKEDTGGLY